MLYQFFLDAAILELQISPWDAMECLEMPSLEDKSRRCICCGMLWAVVFQEVNYSDARCPEKTAVRPESCKHFTDFTGPNGPRMTRCDACPWLSCSFVVVATWESAKFKACGPSWKVTPVNQRMRIYTLQQSNMAMENPPLDDFPIKTSIYIGFPWISNCHV